MSLILYRVTKFFIHFYKAIELFFIKLIGAERIVTRIFKSDGITVNGKQPWDITVHDKSFYARLMSGGPMALGETYMEGLWDCQDIVAMYPKLAKGNMLKYYYNPWNRFLHYMEFLHFNMQAGGKSWEVGKQHYDLGNDLFQAMLDSSMNYTCAYWKNASNLEEAQFNKMELIAGKLNLSEGMTVLDVGCGFGGLAYHLASKYKVKVVGVTVSEEQVAYGKKKCEGLPVDIRLQDYRDVTGKYDRIVAIGMFEHVGWRNYPSYFKTLHSCLKDDGIFLLHTMGFNHHNLLQTEPWLAKYIFPNSMAPFPRNIVDATAKLFVIEDWQNFGFSYSKTIQAWRENFISKWPTLELKYGKKFYRMWTYFLSFCEGMFAERQVQLWQVVLTKDGLKGEYYACR